MVPRRSTKAVAVIVALWVLACAAAFALATTDDEAAAQACGGGGSPSPSESPSASPSGGGPLPTGLPVSLPPVPAPDQKQDVPDPAPRPAPQPPRGDPHEKVAVVTAQGKTCKSTITISYDSGRRAKFTGKVGSDEPMCKRARDVTVKKVKRGADRTVGRSVTNAKGKYKVPARTANGRFYAKVSKAKVKNDDGENVTCQAAKSRRIRP